MLPELPAPGSPQDWLRNAQSDLALARLRRTRGMLYEHLCFHAQQAAEKALKAVLLAHGVTFPRTHDLAFLVDQLPSAISIPPELIDLPTLSKYAVQNRYPGDTIPATAKHRVHAMRLAEHTVGWAKRLVAKT
jgi:HEPN domain-containing protein